jgi:hypothetical protein
VNKQSTKPVKKPRGTASVANDAKASKKAKAAHPVAALAGIFDDDPLWDEFVDAMKRARIEEDANGDVSG